MTCEAVKAARAALSGLDDTDEVCVTSDPHLTTFCGTPCVYDPDCPPGIFYFLDKHEYARNKANLWWRKA